MSVESKKAPSGHTLRKFTEKGVARWGVKEIPALGTFRSEEAVTAALAKHLGANHRGHRRP